MRFIDRVAGGFFCLLLTGFHVLGKILPVRTPYVCSPGKILLIKFPEMGAIVLAYPLMKYLQKEYPDAEIFFLTFASNKPLFSVLKTAVQEKNVLTIRDTSWRTICADTIRVICLFFHYRFDIVFDLDFFSRFSALLTYVTGAPKRVGFYRYGFEGLYRGELLTHKVLYNPHEHISRMYLCLGMCSREKEKNSAEIRYNISDTDICFPKYIPRVSGKAAALGFLDFMGEKKDRIFFINPGEGVISVREWPLENFISLARLLLHDPDACVILIGTYGALPKAEAMLKLCDHERLVNAVGRTSLEDMMELFCLGTALITNDCGAAHLAMLTPIKKFIFFGPETPEVFGQNRENTRVFYSRWPCSPCLSVLNHRVSVCRDNLCLKNISVEEVYNAIMKDCGIPVHSV